MTTTPILGITHVAAAQNNKYLTLNTALDAMEAAVLDNADVNCALGDTTVSDATMKANALLYLTGAPGASFELTLGAVDRWILIFNDTGQTATVKAGTGATTQSLSNNTMGLFVIDGNHVYTLASSGGSYADENARDAIAAMIAAGTHVGVTIVNDDAGNAINFIVTASNSDYQESVRIASTTNLTLSGEYTAQSIALVDGDRVLAAGQTTGADRRIWIVRSGAWDIAEGWDTPDTITTSTQVPVDEGTYEGAVFRLTTTGTITLGTTTLTWGELAATAAASYINKNQGTASYTILSSDNGKWIYMTRNGNQTFTLEEYAVQPMPNGSSFVAQWFGGSGVVKTITADAAVTLNGTLGGSITLSTRYDAYLFRQKSRNVWVAVPWAVASGGGGGITQENAEDYAAAMFTGGSHTGISFSYNDASATVDATVSAEFIEDTAAAMHTGGTHDGISYSYNDGTGKVNATVKPLEAIAIACSDESTAITAGTGKATFRMPYAFTLTAVRASVTTAPTGATLIIDINESGSTILSTKLSIDVSEKTSTTAASAAVISDTSLADDAEITIDFDQVGSTIAGAGVKVYLIGYRT